MKEGNTTLEAKDTAIRFTEPNVENIPEEMKERPQWIVWRAELRTDKRTGQNKWTKVPYGPETFEMASTTDLMTWSHFNEAVTALKVGNFDGIGFVFCSADPFVGLDFDECRNPATGEVDPSVFEYIAKFQNAYAEVSVSGTG